MGTDGQGAFASPRSGTLIPPKKIPRRESGGVSGSEGGFMPSDKQSLKTYGDHGRESVVVHSPRGRFFLTSMGRVRILERRKLAH